MSESELLAVLKSTFCHRRMELNWRSQNIVIYRLIDDKRAQKKTVENCSLSTNGGRTQRTSYDYLQEREGVIVFKSFQNANISYPRVLIKTITELKKININATCLMIKPKRAKQRENFENLILCLLTYYVDFTIDCTEWSLKFAKKKFVLNWKFN